jgi:hypothetical protein
MPLIGGMTKNPINTAILIALIILLINMYVFRDVSTDDGLFVLSLRSAIYILFIATGIIYIHNMHFINEIKKKEGSANLDEIFGSSGVMGGDEISSLSGTQLIPVEINIGGFD